MPSGRPRTALAGESEGWKRATWERTMFHRKEPNRSSMKLERAPEQESTFKHKEGGSMAVAKQQIRADIIDSIKQRRT